jgi:hypothetical protein
VAGWEDPVAGAVEDGQQRVDGLRDRGGVARPVGADVDAEPAAELVGDVTGRRGAADPRHDRVAQQRQGLLPGLVYDRLEGGPGAG